MSLDDYPFGEPLTPANPAASPKQCVRHDWREQRGHPETDEDGRELKPGYLLGYLCLRCGKVRDEAAARRNRANAKRGKSIQRQRIVGLGGQNLPGNKPGHDGIGVFFSYESKSGGFFSERVWRVLRGIPATAQQTRVLIITSADGRGHKARSYVVVEYDEWAALHGESE